MQPEHYRELGAALGVDLGAVNTASSDDVFDFNKRDNPYISLTTGTTEENYVIENIRRKRCRYRMD